MIFFPKIIHQPLDLYKVDIYVCILTGGYVKHVKKSYNQKKKYC